MRKPSLVPRPIFSLEYLLRPTIFCHAHVSNGVGQGEVLSYNYLDEFFARLSKLGVGCHFGNRRCLYTFVGGFGYADDAVNEYSTTSPALPNKIAGTFTISSKNTS